MGPGDEVKDADLLVKGEPGDVNLRVPKLDGSSEHEAHVRNKTGNLIFCGICLHRQQSANYIVCPLVFSITHSHRVLSYHKI